MKMVCILNGEERGKLFDGVVCILRDGDFLRGSLIQGLEQEGENMVFFRIYNLKDKLKFFGLIKREGRVLFRGLEVSFRKIYFDDFRQIERSGDK